MTILELKEQYKGQYSDIEVYIRTDPRYNGRIPFHTDSYTEVDTYSNDSDVVFYDLMGEEAYSHSVLANSCIEADFAGWYGNKNAKVLCVCISKIAEEEEG